MKQEHYVEAAKTLLELSTSVDDISTREELEKVDVVFKGLVDSIGTGVIKIVPGWYIPSIDSITVTGTDLLEITVKLRGPHNEFKEISDTLDTPFLIEGDVIVEEYGGHDKVQQSIVLTIGGEDDQGRAAEASIQLEIDYRTGEFKDASLLQKWDVSHLYDDEEE
jgi:hypothetical protein